MPAKSPRKILRYKKLKNWVGGTSQRGVVQDGRIVVLGRNTLGRMWMQIRDDMVRDGTTDTLDALL